MGQGIIRACGHLLVVKNIPDRYPLPNIKDFSFQLGDKKVFSKKYLLKAFCQMPMALEEIEKTANVTPFGLFAYLRMPFGLRNAAENPIRNADSLVSIKGCHSGKLIRIFQPEMYAFAQNNKNILSQYTFKALESS